MNNYYTSSYNDVKMKKSKSHPKILLLSNITKDINMNVKANELFSPNCAAVQKQRERYRDRSVNNKEYSSYNRKTNHRSISFGKPINTKISSKTEYELTNTDKSAYKRSKYSPIKKSNWNNSKPYHVPDEFFLKRESELLSEIDHLNKSLSEYKRMNSKLNDRLKKSIGSFNTKHNSYNTLSDYNKSEINNLRKKNEELTFINQQLKTDLFKKEGALEDMRFEVNRKESHYDKKIKEYKKKIAYLQSRNDEDKSQELRNRVNKYKGMFDSEKERADAFFKENEKLKEIISNQNKEYLKMVESFNEMKLKQINDNNRVKGNRLDISHEKLKLGRFNTWGKPDKRKSDDDNEFFYDKILKNRNNTNQVDSDKEMASENTVSNDPAKSKYDYLYIDKNQAEEKKKSIYDRPLSYSPVKSPDTQEQDSLAKQHNEYNYTSEKYFLSPSKQKKFESFRCNNLVKNFDSFGLPPKRSQNTSIQKDIKMV